MFISNNYKLIAAKDLNQQVILCWYFDRQLAITHTSKPIKSAQSILVYEKYLKMLFKNIVNRKYGGTYTTAGSPGKHKVNQFYLL